MMVYLFSSNTGHIDETGFTLMALSKITPLPEVWMRLHDPKRLRKIMAIQGVSARQLAEAVGYRSHAYITRLLRGEIKNLTPDRATRVALYLGVGVDDLFMPEGSSDARHSAQRPDRKSA